MNKMLIGIIAIVVVIGGLYFFTQKQYQSSQTQVQQQVQQPTQQVQPTQAQDNVEGNTVTIQNFAFSPAVLNIKQGTKVTWINKDSAPHNIKSDTFNSQDLAQGDKFEIAFNKKGSFDYICGIHPKMKGKIVVE